MIREEDLPAKGTLFRISGEQVLSGVLPYGFIRPKTILRLLEARIDHSYYVETLDGVFRGWVWSGYVSALSPLEQLAYEA